MNHLYSVVKYILLGNIIYGKFGYFFSRIDFQAKHSHGSRLT